MKRILLAGAAAFALTAAQPTLAADAPVYKGPAPVAAALFNWSGFYIGAQAGYGWGQTEHCVIGVCSATFNIDGFVGGGTLGYNWQFGSWVAGIETDLSYSNVKGQVVSTCTTNCITEVRWFGTLRGRVGPTFDRMFLYATGGLAYGEVFGAIPGFPGISGSSKTLTGWTVGGGLEWAFAPNWSAKIEYLHIHLGSFVYGTLIGPGFDYSTSGNFNVVRAGVNLRF